MSRRSAASLAVAAAALTAIALPAPSAATDPRILYMLQCQGCHLADGSGAPGAVPDLRGSMARFLTVEGGREYLVRVPGSAQSDLDDDELAHVLNWMLRAFGPEPVAADSPPFDAAEVARYGRTPLTDVEGLRTELVQAMGSADPAGP